MWDMLVLTAGNELQKGNFEVILSEMDISCYTKDTVVIADYPPGVRIGSGGATLNVLQSLGSHIVGKKVLLIHSGGLSQRMPHLSAFGKIFATLPNGNTILEMKLCTYRSLSTLLPPGLLVSASDVLEDVSAFRQYNSSSEMILFATELKAEIARNHGVFVMDHGKLKSVLQKPSLLLMNSLEAILPNGNVLSDCFFWMSWSICEQLEMLWRFRGPCTTETCCYGDFMRPLGHKPILDYLEEGNAELSSWRKAFADIFSCASSDVINLGPDSFFHMGTAREYQQHNQRDTAFAKKFLRTFSNNVYCTLINCSIGSGSLLEYCRLKDAEIGSGCILSGCESSKSFVLSNGSILFTICITKNERRYTTILLHIDDEVKAEKPRICWMGQETQLREVSLWNAKLFPVERNREASLHTTIKMLKGEESGSERISIADAVATCDLQEMVVFRRQLVLFTSRRSFSFP